MTMCNHLSKHSRDRDSTQNHVPGGIQKERRRHHTWHSFGTPFFYPPRQRNSNYNLTVSTGRRLPTRSRLASQKTQPPVCEPVGGPGSSLVSLSDGGHPAVHSPERLLPCQWPPRVGLGLCCAKARDKMDLRLWLLWPFGLTRRIFARPCVLSTNLKPKTPA
jgi:hypothetical protein